MVLYLGIVTTLFIEPFNLPHAIRLPENVIAPIIIPETMVVACILSPTFLLNSTNPIRAALAPPKPLNKETNSGIFVILTLTAIQPPIAEPVNRAKPMSMYIEIGIWRSCIKIVAAMAIAIPEAAIKFPFFAVAGCPNFFSPRIKAIVAIR